MIVNACHVILSAAKDPCAAEEGFARMASGDGPAPCPSETLILLIELILPLTA